MSNIINRIFTSKRNTKQSGYPSQVSDIGTPFEVRHNVHVGFNHATGKIEGLPKPWLNLINGSHITQAEQANNPEAVISALKLVTYVSSKRAQDKYLVNQDMIDNEIMEIEDTWPRSKDSSKILEEEDVEHLRSVDSGSSQPKENGNGGRDEDEEDDDDKHRKFACLGVKVVSIIRWCLHEHAVQSISLG